MVNITPPSRTPSPTLDVQQGQHDATPPPPQAPATHGSTSTPSRPTIHAPNSGRGALSRAISEAQPQASGSQSRGAPTTWEQLFEHRARLRNSSNAEARALATELELLHTLRQTYQISHASFRERMDPLYKRIEDALTNGTINEGDYLAAMDDLGAQLKCSEDQRRPRDMRALLGGARAEIAQRPDESAVGPTRPVSRLAEAATAIRSHALEHIRAIENPLAPTVGRADAPSPDRFPRAAIAENAAGYRGAAAPARTTSQSHHLLSALGFSRSQIRRVGLSPQGARAVQAMAAHAQALIDSGYTHERITDLAMRGPRALREEVNRTRTP